MDTEKIGSLIRQLRTGHGLTQKALADRLHLSDRTISKWERGCGSPDVSLLKDLAHILGVDVQSLLTGELRANTTDRGNMKRIIFYRCSLCGNILTSTGGAAISCCGRKLESLIAQPAQGVHGLRIEEVEDEYFITVDHPMEKEHYLSFVACVTDDRALMVRMYPEQAAQTRFPRMPRASWYLGCTQHGLFKE